MENIEKLINNIKQQAEVYLLDAGEFYPFGVGIDNENNIKPFSAYLADENDRPSSLGLIELLEKHVETALTDNYLIAAIAIDVTLKENEKSFDALEVRFFEKDKAYRKHIKYLIKKNKVEFYNT